MNNSVAKAKVMNNPVAKAIVQSRHGGPVSFPGIQLKHGHV